jgi:hypothetical protein
MGPFTVDLAHAGAVDYFKDGDIDAYVRLEEADPADPGQQSGLSLHMTGLGECLHLGAELDAVQQEGTMLTHCLGLLRFEDVTPLIASDATSVTAFASLCLREVYFDEYAERPSGGRLELHGGDDAELRVVFGAHIFGVLRGHLLSAFLNCLRLRCAQPAQ